MMLEMIDVKRVGATEEIINAQKALSKVIINREKENAIIYPHSFLREKVPVL